MLGHGKPHGNNHLKAKHMAAKQKFSTALILFSLTLFLSAALMFAVQPMVGKMLLPLVGGTPAGWVVAMAFFQVMLLAGYLLAHIMSKAAPVGHALLYLAVLAAGGFFLPIDLAQHISKVSESPGAWDIFLLLTFAVAFPFIALSTTASTIQRLFTATGHEAAGDPYFLYAASNIGSFSGLLLYPLLVEPLFTISAQASLLLSGYILLMLGVASCIALAHKNRKAVPAVRKAPKNSTPIPFKTCAEWVVLAFIPSSLLMGSTSYITTDIVSVPMIWALPLSLYLLTFILAFGKKTFAGPELLSNIALYLILFFIGSSLTKVAYMNGWSGATVVMATFFFAALACHARLASLRPLENAEKEITVFYLMMALGGALGGVLNAFIVPHIFNNPKEFHLILIASLFLRPEFREPSKKRTVFAVLLLLAFAWTNLSPINTGDAEKFIKYGIFLAPVVVMVLSVFNRTRPRKAAVAMLTLILFLLALVFVTPEGKHLMSMRNFYGTITVAERKVQMEGREYTLRYMHHGTTVHGLQIMDPALETLPTTYYTHKGPVGKIFEAMNPEKVAVIGLGTGSINCYPSPKRSFTYIEIDEAVVETARKYFTLLDKCKSKEPPRIIIGDGRLELEKLKDEKFDLLVVDAFTSDSIPTHLLTKEAFEVYARKLNSGGMVLINISNRYLSLWDTISVSAAPAGFLTKLKANYIPEESVYGSGSIWVALAQDESTLAKLSSKEWLRLPSNIDTAVWTDDYTNLLGTFPMFKKPFVYDNM
jgi:spermidine synthase